MFNLLKKELKSLLLNPFVFSLIFLLNAAFVAVFAVYMKIMQGMEAYAGFENMISLSALFFAAIIPLVTVLSLKRDKKFGREEFLFSMPVSRNTAALSKIIAQVLLFAIPTAVLGIFPLLFSWYGVVNFAQAYLALLMLFAFELFIIGLSAMLALKTKKSLTAILISYSALFLSFVFGILSALVRLLPFGTKFDQIAGGILNELSIFKKVDIIVNELFDLSAFCFFIIGAIFFVVIALLKIKKQAFTAAVSILLVFAVGASAIALPYHIRQADINKNKLYSPSDSVKEYLSSVEDEIKIYLIDPYTNENPLNNAITRTVAAGKNVELEIVNTAEDREFLEKYGLDGENQESLYYSMIVESSKRWRFINSEDYFYYYNTDRKEYLSASELQTEYTYYASVLNQYGAYYDSLSDNAKSALDSCEEALLSLQNNTYTCLQFENAFADAVAYVTAEAIPTVYFLVGHGEKGTVINSYDFKEEGKLPENADLIVINSPSEDYTKSETDMLLEYLDNDGKLYVLTDAGNTDMPNFDNLLAHYGLTVDNSVISEDESDIVTVAVNKEHEAFSAMSASEVIFKGVSKINIADNSDYNYSTMLSYKHTEGEGDEAKTEEYPVALSVSDGNNKKITLFTGAVTFNEADNGIGEEELNSASACVTNVMQWMFDGFESGLTPTTPKLYQKTLYLAEDSSIAKTVVVFAALIAASAVAAVVYMVSRKLRSKKEIEENSNSQR